LFILAMAACTPTSDAAVLITSQEAALPRSQNETPHTTQAPAGTERRGGVGRNPSIRVQMPGLAPVASPFHLGVLFTAYGVAQIDRSKISIRYVREPEVDLSASLKPYMTGNGIDMPDAEAPH